VFAKRGVLGRAALLAAGVQARPSNKIRDHQNQNKTVTKTQNGEGDVLHDLETKGKGKKER